MRIQLTAILFINFIVLLLAAPGSHLPQPPSKDVAVYDSGTFSNQSDFSTDLTLTDNHFYWSVGAKVLYFSGLVGSFSTVVIGCRSVDGSASSNFACAWGVMATACTLSGLAIEAIRAYIRYSAGNIMNNRLQSGLGQVQPGRRGEDSEEARLLEAVRSHMGPEFHIHGYVHKNSTLGSKIVPEGFEYWPVAQFLSPDGINHMHITTHHSNGKDVIRMGYAPNAARRGGFNEQYFTSGGIDFEFCTAESQYRLSKLDWGNMYDAMRCYFPRLESNGAKIQLYEMATDNTMAIIGISLVTPYDQTGIYQYSNCVGGVGWTACERAYSHVIVPP